MDIQVQILSTAQETKQNARGGSYQQIEVTYKDLTNGGKVASKKIMDFSSKEVFQTFVLAHPAEVYNVTMEKKGDYWNWVRAMKTTAAASTKSADTPTTTTASGSATKGGWETPDERAKKQVYIIRQSSLSTAVEALSVGRKGEIKVDEILELAKRFEAFVFGDTTSGSLDVGTIETIPEDLLPF